MFCFVFLLPKGSLGRMNHQMEVDGRLSWPAFMEATQDVVERIWTLTFPQDIRDKERDTSDSSLGLRRAAQSWAQV